MFVASLTLASVLVTPRAAAEPASCDDPSCTPGIKPGVTLGAQCDDTAHWVFGTTSWGRLVFCGSPRRYEPRYFRSPLMVGVKEESTSCTGRDQDVAQTPQGLFLTCVSKDGWSYWERGDL